MTENIIQLHEKSVGEGWNEFWAAYPRKVAKKAALNAFCKAISREGFGPIMAGLKRYIEATKDIESQYILHAATWLNGDRWEDEPDQPGFDPISYLGGG